MQTTKSNIRTFEESSLPPEQYNRAINYVCYERNFFYIFSNFYQLEQFPLFHLDRFLGWTYGEGNEPLLPAYNGFGDLLDTHIRQESETNMENLWQSLHDIFSAGHRVSMNMWVKHTDGTPYVTSVLFEGMDENKTVYFTKVNETLNHTCSPMSFDELQEKLSVDDDGTIGLVIIRDADVINKLAAMNVLDAYRYLFADVYGFSFENGELRKHGEPTPYVMSGFDRLLDFLDVSMNEVITENGVPKNHQFRLNKHIHNRFQPIQYYFEYVTQHPELAPLLSDELKEQVQAAMTKMDATMKNVLKFASFLVQKPEPQIYQLYVKAIRGLYDLQPEYQQANLNILQAIMA
jgi:hypothetical protein